MGTFAPALCSALLAWIAIEYGMGWWTLLFVGSWIILFVADVKGCKVC